ncbi:MAG: T9SS type A sorting domain-containing protein [Bacteroidales bacterium]|jgi:hypothetical protein|nr:T9SS type A sorting domain-containing protein [Bacteroidales bacterium]
MKKLILTLLAFSLISLTYSQQTATNFTCNDCNGTSHDLFTELDSGKVIVLCWVMPCGSCVNPSNIAYNLVTSYQSTNPGQVLFYMVDDYANTSCNALNNWGNLYGIPASSFSLRFSNSTINMLDYGSEGMPKTVIVAGPSHGVFYNMNNTNNPALMERAIDSALQTINQTGIGSNLSFPYRIYPNPAHDRFMISFHSNHSDYTSIKLINMMGITVKDVDVRYINGDNNLSISCDNIPRGTYFINMITKDGHISSKVTIQ